MRLLLRNCCQVVQVVSDGRKFLRGEKEMKELPILEGNNQGEGISIVVDE